MRINRLFIAAAILLVIGTVAFASGSHGDVGIKLGLPISATAINIAVHVDGARALLTIATLAPGAIVLIVALIVALVGEIRRA